MFKRTQKGLLLLPLLLLRIGSGIPLKAESVTYQFIDQSGQTDTTLSFDSPPAVSYAGWTTSEPSSVIRLTLENNQDFNFLSDVTTTRAVFSRPFPQPELGQAFNVVSDRGTSLDVYTSINYPVSFPPYVFFVTGYVAPGIPAYMVGFSTGPTYLDYQVDLPTGHSSIKTFEGSWIIPEPPSVVLAMIAGILLFGISLLRFLVYTNCHRSMPIHCTFGTMALLLLPLSAASS